MGCKYWETAAAEGLIDYDQMVQYPFGHGLSYTTYRYDNLKLDKSAYDANDTIHVSVDVTNAGDRDGSEIVQVYVTKQMVGKQRDNKPFRQLKGFTKVFLKAGETKTVTVDVPLKEVTFWSNLRKKMVVENGPYTLAVGTSSANLPCAADFTVSGQWNAGLSNVYATASAYCLDVGGQSQIQPSATLEDATHLCMWEYRPVYLSSDETVATVDDCGRVTARKAGTASITVAVTYGGRTLSAKVPVAVR